MHMQHTRKVLWLLFSKVLFEGDIGMISIRLSYDRWPFPFPCHPSSFHLPSYYISILFPSHFFTSHPILSHLLSLPSFFALPFSHPILFYTISLPFSSHLLMSYVPKGKDRTEWSASLCLCIHPFSRTATGGKFNCRYTCFVWVYFVL